MDSSGMNLSIFAPFPAKKALNPSFFILPQILKKLVYFREACIITLILSKGAVRVLETIPELVLERMVTQGFKLGFDSVYILIFSPISISKAIESKRVRRLVSGIR